MSEVLYCPICRCKTWHIGGVCEWSDGHAASLDFHRRRIISDKRLHEPPLEALREGMADNVDDEEGGGTDCILCTVAEVERLRRIEQCARYLINSNAWVGDTEGIEANLMELQELLNVRG